MMAALTTGNPGRSTHSHSEQGEALVQRVRELTAGHFEIEDSNRVILTGGATMSLNMAIQGILRPGDHVVTTCLEHTSVLRPLRAMENQRGCRVSIVRRYRPDHEFIKLRTGNPPRDTPDRSHSCIECSWDRSANCGDHSGSTSTRYIRSAGCRPIGWPHSTESAKDRGRSCCVRCAQRTHGTARSWSFVGQQRRCPPRAADDGRNWLPVGPIGTADAISALI